MIIKCIYLAYFAGLCLWQFPLLYSLFLTVRNRFLIRRNLKEFTQMEDLQQTNSFGERVRMAVKGASMEKIFPTPQSFYAASGILAGASFFMASVITDGLIVLFFALFMGLVPGAGVMVRLYSRRVARSREADVLVQELLNNYKIYGFNMKEAVEKTATEIEEAPYAKGLLLDLAKGLNSAVTRQEVERLLAGFRYSIDTAWSNVLATNIFFAHVYGVRVDKALEDLLESITKSRKVIEHGKRENNEARLMLQYLAPASFAFSAVVASRYFGFTLRKFIKYQFGTALGIRWFMIMTMLYVAGVVVNGFFSREKMDI